MTVLGKGELVLVGSPGIPVFVGPGSVGEGEASRGGVVVWVKISGRGVPVIGDGVLVGGWGVIEATPAK